MISVAAPSNANCVLPPRRSRGTLLCRGGTALSRVALPCQGSTAFLALRSNPRFFFPFFTIFLQFSLFYGILPCFTQNNTVIISAFLQLFPIIYKFYGKTAFCKKLFTVILFCPLPLSHFLSAITIIKKYL